jgi:hypothetical protein
MVRPQRMGGPPCTTTRISPIPKARLLNPNGHFVTCQVWPALIHFARKLVEARGQVSDADPRVARGAGFGDGIIAEVVAHVALHIFTNYFNLVARLYLDFPSPSPLLPATAPAMTV